MNIDIFITNDCNMGCLFCGSWKQDELVKYISLDRVKQILDTGKEYGFKYTTLSGGEPFLHPDIFDIIDYADMKGYWINITTNGLLIDEDAVRYLSNKKVNVRISLHTLNNRLHNKITDTDTLDQVCAAIQLLYEKNLFYSLGSTIYQENVTEIEQLADFAFRHKALFIRFTPVMSVFKGSDIRLEGQFYETILFKIINAAIKYNEFLNYSKKIPYFINDPIDVFTTRQCPAGSNLFMIVDSNEIVIPCQFLPREMGFPLIPFKSIESYQTMKEEMDKLFTTKINGNLKGECGVCIFKATCCGGCLGNKVTVGLAITGDQPICLRSILKIVLKKFDSNLVNSLYHYWYYHYSQRVSSSDVNRSCMRKLPFWELNFDYYRVFKKQFDNERHKNISAV